MSMYMLICCLSILWLSLYCCTLTRKNRLCLYCKAFYYKTTSFVIILGKYVCLFSKVRSNCVCVLACVRACVCVWFSLMSNNVKLSFNFQRSCKSSIFFEQHLCGHQQRSNILLNTTSTCMNALCRNIYIDLNIEVHIKYRPPRSIHLLFFVNLYCSLLFNNTTR